MGTKKKPPKNEDDFSPLPVAIYCRVSTDDQDCSRQIADLTAAVARSGETLVQMFVEKISGRAKKLPERRKVIELARRKEIKAIRVTHLTRWGRSASDLWGTFDELRGYGVGIITLSGLNLDLTTPEARMIAQVMAAFAEFEVETRREEIKSGLASARARGKTLGRPKGRSSKVAKVEDQIIQLHRMDYGPTQIKREVAATRKVYLERDTIRRVIREWQENNPVEADQIPLIVQKPKM